MSSEYLSLKLTSVVRLLLVQLIAVGCSVLLVHRYVGGEEVCGCKLFDKLENAKNDIVSLGSAI